MTLLHTETKKKKSSSDDADNETFILEQMWLSYVKFVVGNIVGGVWIFSCQSPCHFLFQLLSVEKQSKNIQSPLNLTRQNLFCTRDKTTLCVKSYSLGEFQLIGRLDEFPGIVILLKCVSCDQKWSWYPFFYIVDGSKYDNKNDKHNLPFSCL